MELEIKAMHSTTTAMKKKIVASVFQRAMSSPAEVVMKIKYSTVVLAPDWK